jgi:hypothetical protein
MAAAAVVDGMAAAARVQYSDLFNPCFGLCSDEEIVANTGCERDVLWFVSSSSFASSSSSPLTSNVVCCFMSASLKNSVDPQSRREAHSVVRSHRVKIFAESLASLS